VVECGQRVHVQLKAHVLEHKIQPHLLQLWAEKRYEQFLRLGIEQPEITQVVLSLFTSFGFFDHYLLLPLIVEGLQLKVSFLDEIKHLLS